MQVVVKNGNVERAMRTLKKKLQKEGPVSYTHLTLPTTLQV